jgi:hypothetical protein
VSKSTRVKSYCPWLVAEDDINPAESGVFARDLSVDGQAQRHYGLPVLGQFDSSLSLGMLALRCERKGSLLMPLSLALVDTPPTEERHPAMDLRLLQRNPARHLDHDDNGANVDDGDMA